MTRYKLTRKEEIEYLGGKSLDEPEVFGLDSELQLGTKQLLGRIERHIETTDARVGCRKEDIIGRTNHDRGMQLESFRCRWQRRSAGPEEYQLLEESNMG